MNSIFDEIRSALHSVWNRRWLALAVAWVVSLLGWLVVAMIPNSYESKARLFVQVDDVVAETMGFGLNDRKRDIDRVQQTLTSSINLEKVARATNIVNNNTPQKEVEMVVVGLSKAIKVVSNQSNLFEISAIARNGSLSEAQNAKLAQNIVQTMINIFHEENMVGGKGGMAQKLAFIDQQLADRQRELEAAEQRRTMFESQHPEMVQGGVGAMQRLESSRSELRGVEGDLAAAQSSLAAITGQLAGTPQTIAGVGPSGGTRGGLNQATSDLAAMRARGLTENHPDVIALKNQIAQLRALVQAEGPGVISGTPNPAYSSLLTMKLDKQAAVQGLQARKASLQSDVAQLMASQFSNPAVASEAQRVARDYDALKLQFDKLSQDREQLRLRNAMQDGGNSVNFRVVDPPTTPRAPIAPNRPVLMFAVLILGIGSGIGAAFALAQLGSTFATTAKLERALGRPVLGSISETLTAAAKQQRKRKQHLFIAGTAALAGVFVLLLVVDFLQLRMVA
jgi:polysaccharide chain length determinant protein (PEP-CTERM system associated)